MKIRTMIFVALLAMSGQSNGTFLSGSALLQKCESPNVSIQNICAGFLMGVADASDAYLLWDLLTSKQFCIPGGVGVQQLRKIFIKDANEHPEELHLSAASQVVNAFGTAFPCK